MTAHVRFKKWGLLLAGIAVGIALLAEASAERPGSPRQSELEKPRTGHWLVRNCQPRTSDATIEELLSYTDCVAYVMGSIDMAALFNSKAPQKEFCLPEKGLAPTVLIEAIRVEVAKKPDLKSLSARGVIYVTLVNQFRCTQ